MTDSTIIFPNFNNEFVLPYTFQYLEKYLDVKKYKIIVVDDGSTDNGVAVCKKYLSSVPFQSTELIEVEHHGIINALNTALDAVKTEFVFRIDGDATVETPDWIERIKGQLTANPQIGLIGGQVIFDHGQIHSFGRSVVSELGLYDMGTIPIEPVGHRTYDSMVIRPKGDFISGNPYEVDTLLGVCAGFRKEDAVALGKFDPLFGPVWIEDDDFGLMMRRHNKKVLVDPAIKITHRVSLRGSRNPNAKRKSFGEKISLERFKMKIEKKFVDRSKFLSIPEEKNEWRSGILQRHYKNWKVKWGFDPLNPKMDDIYEKYWSTQVCWKVNPELYRKAIK